MPVISQDSTTDSPVCKQVPVSKKDLLTGLRKIKDNIDEIQRVLHRQLLDFDKNKRIKALDDLSDQHYAAHCDALVSVHELKKLIQSIPTERE